MFWYLPPLKTCKLVPISLNHIWLGAKQFPHRVHPKKRLALEFEPHCQSNYWLEFEPHCQSTGTGEVRWVRARTGTRASAPDVSAPLRARTGTRECPGPAPLRAWGTREPVPTAPLREGDGRVPRPCAAAREQGEGGRFARLARGPAARNRQCACASPGPAVRRKRGGWPRVGGGAQLPCARARACASAPAHNTSIACRAYALQSAPSLTPVCWASQQGWSQGFQDSAALGQVQTTLQRMH